MVQGFKHGHNRTGAMSPTYQTWRGMVSRCHCATDGSYHYYGGRGITVCDRWRDFRNFLADMGERPDGKEIDRIDPDQGYFLENCRWITRAENMARTRQYWITPKNQSRYDFFKKRDPWFCDFEEVL